ncbi:MAG: EF-hand domain-containing protein [Verrucomicrobia bacterium]|nr:EF-hand domain-containing protein [Verrucomicrobiota bacterium]
MCWIALAACLLIAPLARALPAAAQIATAFKALDATGNGSISVEEWERGSFALFRAADKNNNDFIDADELAGSALAQDTFLRADTNRDGKLSVGEFMALRRALFQLADIDRNDSLSRTEFDLLILMEQVGWQDQNRNDRIELSELGESLKKAFALLDTDQDGHLTPAEAAYLAADTFKHYDRDGDGRLTVDEFVGGYRHSLQTE